ncbi:hypothetical protein IMG5_082400 [Ichthyophthirius multifiliis]|uniref:Transmembrane protein n=1 Tax=Ichthyophthirius multifiliis TaxID=5932 RepID=G0QQP8_ICHMU|nr:hypothetical protein IMG5_082400 [Ichthyophthirius multifiliis]EGR32454.1 hypothetical protein IMG5_082400 [Ichthyophthirius multifiliis]|eukprot:XP_004036440.1 hypothetical protein IMG5_082400 [Ichthyophthirius multifiliis]
MVIILNILVLILNVQNLLLFHQKIILKILMLVVIQSNVLPIILKLLQLLLIYNINYYSVQNKIKEKKLKSWKDNQNLVTLLVLIIIENFVIIHLNVLIIALEKVFAYLDNVDANQGGQELIVILVQKIALIILQKKIQNNVFNIVLQINFKILIKYVEISVLKVFTMIQIIYVQNVIISVYHVLALQRINVQNAVFVIFRRRKLCIIMQQ